MESNIKGNDNTVIQINGLTYTETKEICQDIITKELNEYKSEAYQIALQREETLTNRFLSILNEKNINDKQALEELKNPDMQYCFRQAQIAYMRNGTSELENILSNILAERLVENKRTTLQIALGEAINTVSVLLPEHLDILSLTFIFRYTKFLGIKNRDSFMNRLKPFISNLVKTLKGISKKELDSIIAHIEYAKCGIEQLTSVNLLEHLKKTYSGLFMEGFTEKELEKACTDLQYPDIFMMHLEKTELYQIKALDEEILETLISDYNEETQKKIKSLFKENIMSTEKIKDMIIKYIPEFEEFLQIWEYGLGKLTLTSVGIILGRMNLKKFNNDEFDMKIWIKR